jgi:hypothetical protein
MRQRGSEIREAVSGGVGIGLDEEIVEVEVGVG